MAARDIFSLFAISNERSEFFRGLSEKNLDIQYEI